MIAKVAHGALRALESPYAIDQLCEEAIAQPSGNAAQLCREVGCRPQDDERAALFFLVTRQLDSYFEADFEFQSLRLEYDRANKALRQEILRVVRSGDRRLLGFFARRKPLSECTREEVDAAVRSFVKHQDWPRLFQAFVDLPLKYGLPILHQLKKSGWEPPEPDARSLLRGAVRALGDLIPPTPKETPAASPLFDSWLTSGREEYADTPVETLLERLPQCAPPEGVALVAALAGRVSPGSEAAQSIAEHRHWLVRLAGLTVGIVVPVDLNEIDDDVDWVRRLAPEYPALQIPPRHATPALLESLATAPDSIWSGSLGTTRKILQALLAYRTTAGTFEEIVVEVGAEDGEFVPIIASTSASNATAPEERDIND